MASLKRVRESPGQEIDLTDEHGKKGHRRDAKAGIELKCLFQSMKDTDEMVLDHINFTASQENHRYHRFHGSDVPRR